MPDRADDMVVTVKMSDIDFAEAKKVNPKKSSPASYETAIVACGFGKFHYKLLLSMIPLTACQLFSSGSMAFILPTAECDLNLHDYQKGMLNGATYLGNLMTGLVWGGVSDVIGRQKLIALCFLFDFVVSLACSFVHTYWMLLILKIIAGAIMAGPNSLIYAYLAEVNDDKHRSMAIMIAGMGFAFAQIMQPLLAYALLPLEFRVPLVPGVLDLTSWRVFFIVCALPSLWSGLWFLRFPESPKFLMSKCREAEALRVFQRIYAVNTGNPPDTYPIKSLEISEAVQPLDGEKQKGGFRKAVDQFKPLFRKPYLFRILMIIAIQVNIMLCINSLRLWTTQLFALMEQYESLDHSVVGEATTACQMIAASLTQREMAETGNLTVASSGPGSAACSNPAVSGEVYLRSVIIGSVGTSSLIISSWASKRFGKRPLMLYSFPVGSVAALVMIWAISSDMFMGLLSIFMPATAIGLSALSAVTVDLFPTSLRGVSVSLTVLSGRCASLSGNIILPFLLNISCETVFIFITVCLGLCSILVWFVPTKKGEDV